MFRAAYSYSNNASEPPTTVPLATRFSIQRDSTVIRNVVPRVVQARSESDAKVQSYDCYFRDP
jgi:hypothetical protein